MIAYVRLALDKYGLANSIPQSTVCVDEDYWYMRGGNCVVDDPDCKWPCTSIFHTRDPKSIKLNSTLSQTVHGVPDEVVAGQLKEILFKTCRDSQSEFFELRCKVCHTKQRKQDSSLGRHSCCECSYIKCCHYEDVLYISREARQYYQAVCPKCVMKIGSSCHRFWKCYILTMKLRKEFKTITQAYDFVSNCFHFKYERAYIELCMEGNVYENSCCHAMRYFLNIDRSESLTSQRLKQISMSNKVVDSLLPSSSVALLNPVCRPLFNGAKCTNCEMQDNTNKGSYYVPLRP